MKATVHSSMDGKDYPELMDKAVERGLTKLGIVIEGDAVAQVPVDTGRLKGSITYATKGGRSDAQHIGDEVSRPMREWTLHVGSNVEYAQHVEYGTKFMKKKPYLRPALDQNRSRSPRILQTEIREAMQRGK